MRLYFLRHGHAEAGTSDDFSRRLTEIGKERMQNAAQVMARLGIQPTHIYSSPRTRAEQTAEIVAKALNCEVEINDAVNFEFDLDAVAALVDPLDDDDEVMFVGHNPSMSEVISDLTGADVNMKKGGLARVDIVNYAPPIQGQLVWLIAPKVFDALDD